MVGAESPEPQPPEKPPGLSVLARGRGGGQRADSPSSRPTPVLDSLTGGAARMVRSAGDGVVVDGLQLALLVIAAYLIGALPMGVMIARISGGTDPRTVGSGRTGGTNALRALGRKWATVVVVGDVLKGTIPVLLARWLSGGDAGVEVACAAAAVFGSSHSVFVGFRGGRGVGTGVGTMLVIQPLVLPLIAPVFILVILVTRYVSLGSLLGSAATLPAMLLIWAVASGAVPPAYLAWAAAGPAIVWLAHRDNILRLLRGQERKFDLTMIGGRGGQAA